MAWALLGSSQPRFDQDDVAIEPPAPGPTRVFVVDASGTHHALHVDLRETLRLFQERIEAVLECPASAQRLYVDRVAFRSGTLEANGIPDEDVQFDHLDIDPDTFIPIIHLYFSDDLTVA